MNILSFVYGDGCHDTAAAIVCDGELVAAAEEERFTRRKHETAFPLAAIEFCLQRAGLRMAEVDRICVPEKPFRTGPDSYLAGIDFATLKKLRRDGRAGLHTFAHCFLLRAGLRKLGLKGQIEPAMAAGLAALHERYAVLPEVQYRDHHLCHAAAAYLTAGLEQAAIATADYSGGPYATVTWSAAGNQIRRLRAEPLTNSLGRFYYDSTVYLGLKEFGEGKTMGLASYGAPELFADAVELLLKTEGSEWYRYAQPPAAAVLGFARRNQEPILEGAYAHFAAAVQQALERAVRRIANSALEESRSRNLCLGGGVALNCSSNGSLAASRVADSVALCPASNDAGLCIGAALMAAAEAGELKRTELDHAYWGPEFSVAECEAALRSEPQVTYCAAGDVAGAVAAALAQGEVVGWFQGRMEIGPRALGNRSILADPRKVETRDRVNRLKGRERWRPLAPVVRAERATEFFELTQPSPFMLMAARVRPEKRAQIPAVVHVDGTARPQTVRLDQNPRLYALLQAFERRAGVPVLLNTSFNAAGEPIVCTPRDAIRTFLNTGLDLLVIDNFLVRSREQLHAHTMEMPACITAS